MANAGDAIGPYEIQGHLGAGGMGEVYRALDRRVGRQVALKILPESLAREEDRRRRFEQEARLAASLNHPNIMAIYDVGLDSQPPYIVSELVPGESLRAVIGKGPMAPRRAADLAAQIASGLAAAHAAGIVHRDLKPENVIVTPEGTAKILDFGVARMQAKAAANAGETATMAHTSAGAVVGTAAYMSPEQARAEDVDYRSDQFALGLVLHELITGKQPFARASAVQTMSAIVEDDPPAIERAIPAQLRWILERCLAKERSGRYDSTADLARELAYLRDHFSELSGTATGERPAIVSRPRARRAPLAIGAMAAGAIAAWCAAAWLRDPTSVNLAQYRLTPFATSMPAEAAPSWSPDGKDIVFWGHPENARTQLYVQTVDGASAAPVTGGGAFVVTRNPAFWSPDSRFLYFNCVLQQQVGICRVPASGGEAMMVQAHVYTASISPDGRTLAMLDDREPVVYTASPPDGPRRKYEPAPFRASQFYNNPILRFAPDGKSILLFLALGGQGETAWLLPWPPGTARRVLPAEGQFAFTPTFSWFPDSRHVLFGGSSPDSEEQLFAGDVNSGKIWPILAEDRPASNPTVSPDGSRAAYQSNLSHLDIVAAPLSEEPVQTLLGSFRDQGMVNQSPAGPQIVYVTNRRGTQEVWISSLAEGWERPLLSPSDVQENGKQARFFMSPTFSADGKRIAVAAGVHGSSSLYTVFASGGTPLRATNEQAVLECAPTWSPDGAWIAYVLFKAGENSLMKVRPGSGQAPVRIASHYTSSVPEWSPTGEWISDYDAHGKLILVSPDGSKTLSVPGDSGPVTWSHDGRTLYQVRSQLALYAIDISTGKDRKLRDLSGLRPVSALNPGLSISLSHDEKTIAFTVERQRTEIWLLGGVQLPRPWYSRMLGR